MKRLGGPMGLGWGCLRWGYAGCAGAALLIAVAGCSPPFSAGNGASSTGGGGSGSSTTSTSGTGTGTGGAASCTAGACASGEYCNPQSHACESCITSTRFMFGTPVVVPLTLPMAGASALYPRVDPPTVDLYLVQQAQVAGHLNQIATASPDAGKPFPWSLAMYVAQLHGTNNQDSGPFPLQDPSQLEGLVADSISKLGMPVLLFDSDRLGGRHVFAVGLVEGVEPTQVVLPGNASDESRIAVATGASTPRFFWISNTGAAAGDHLVTTTAASNAAIPVSITLNTGCVTPLPDTPWVTPGGDRLLFSSPEYLGASCTAANATVTHLYQVVLSSTGQPMGSAQRIFQDDATIDTTPSLTPDRCELLFSRVDASGVEIYAAPRD